MTASDSVITEIEENDKTEIKDIQEKILRLNDDADSIATEALDEAKTSDLNEHQETLVQAITAIQEATGEDEKKDGVLGSLMNKLTGNIKILNKAKKSAKETFIENASLKDNIDTIFDALEGSIASTEKDLDNLSKHQKSLKESVGLGNELIKEIESMLEDLDLDNDDDQFKKSKLEGLLRELKSINLVNNNTANQITAQVNMTSGLATSMREVKPILRNLIKSQTFVALQNARLGQARNVRDLVSGVVNDFVSTNNKNTHDTILDSIEYSGKTIIEKETVEELGSQHKSFVKELSHVAQTINREKLAYSKTVDKVTGELNEGLTQLPRLMSGTKSLKSLEEK